MGRIKYHLVFLGVVIVMLTLLFGHSWGNTLAAFVYVAILTPIVVGIVYVFNLYLIPRYLIPRKIFEFTLYSCLLVSISLLLESYLILFSFILLGHFDFHSIAPNASDTVLLFVVLYFFVFGASCISIFKHLSAAHHRIDEFEDERNQHKLELLEVVSNRKRVNIHYHTIQYIESLSDYIIIHTSDKEIRSKERISKLQKRLPSSFVRIHRSFIINKDNITSCTNDFVTVNDIDLPIGRSFRDNTKKLSL